MVTSHRKKQAPGGGSRRPKKLAPLEDKALTGPAGTSTGGLRNSQSMTITIKRDLMDAVRRIAPASIEPSPIIFRDISSELKTVRILFFMIVLLVILYVDNTR